MDSETESAIRASRGAVLTPLPILSTVLTIKASNQPVASIKKGLLIVDSPYPIKTNIFLFLTLSDNDPISF